MMTSECNAAAALVAPLAGEQRSEEDSCETSRPAGRLRFLIGLLLLGVVVFLWVFSSFLTQFLYDNPDVDYQKPTAMTAISCSTASIFLLPYMLGSQCRRRAGDQAGQNSEWPKFQTVLLISLNWFFCQWSFNLSLAHTALATNTMLSSSSVVWSYIITVCLGLRQRSTLGLVCILLALSGISLAVFGQETRVDPNAPVDEFFGEALALGSAMAYGVFSNMLAMKVTPNQMGRLWGLVGVVSAVTGAVLMLIGHFTGLETFEAPSSRALSIMLLNGVVGTAVSDYIWAQGVLLTSPLVGNVCLNFTIPLSMVVDVVILRQHKFSWTAPTGGVLVFGAVAAAALDEVRSQGSSAESTDSSAEISDTCGRTGRVSGW